MSQEIDTTIISANIDSNRQNLPKLNPSLCPNCNEILTGNYCAFCGQKNFNLLRPFWTLIEDAFGDLFAFDSRFLNTLYPLFLKPGYITREFNRGRRASFVPPFRQYLVVSVIFFLLLVNIDFQLFDTNSIKLNNATITQSENNIIPFSTHDSKDNNASQEISDKTLNSPSLVDGKTVEEVLENTIEKIKKENADNNNAIHTDITPKENVISFITGIKKIWQDPKLLNKIFAEWIPKMMFFMLPLFAVILKIFYIGQKKYYIEHLVFSLHYHAFIFLLFTGMLLCYHFIPISRNLLPYIFWYIPLYLWIALFTIYRQSPAKTFFKGFFIGLTYCIFIATGIITVIGYGLTKV
ncbi:MAG: DUF3667 domain-containing protein [Emcibacter sp.]|nr:DUF3667 domain-containing protein [Emcibacter sp.]